CENSQNLSLPSNQTILNVSATSSFLDVSASHNAENSNIMVTNVQQKNWSQIRVKEEIMDESESTSFRIPEPRVQSDVETTLSNHSNRSSAFQLISNQQTATSAEAEQRTSFDSNHNQTNNPNMEYQDAPSVE